MHSGAYGIQLGAFSSEAAANTEWHLLMGRFGPELQGLTEHVVMAETAATRPNQFQLARAMAAPPGNEASLPW